MSNSTSMENLTDDFVKISTEYSMSNESLKKLFLKESTFLKHYDAQQSSYGNYASALVILLSQKVELSLGTKARILAACWATKHLELVDYLINGLRQVNGMENSNISFGFAEILKALNLLDTNRKVRQLEKKLKKLEGNSKTKPDKVSLIKAKLNELKNEPVPHGSVSGALSRNIATWVSSLPPSILEYYALTLPKEPWKELANLVHLSPKHFQLPWFLDYVYDKEVPSDTIVKECQKIFFKEEPEVLKVLNKWKIPYSFLRRQLQGTLANSDDAYMMPVASTRGPARGKGLVLDAQLSELKRTRKYQSTGKDCGLTEIVFAFDTTGSMSAAIEQVEKKVTETMARLYRDSPSIRIGLVAHGDYCDGESKAYQMMDFVGNEGMDVLTKWVEQKIRTGGGDAPECYELVLKNVHSMFSWTPGSRRILVMIGDDSPHPPKVALQQQKQYGFANPIEIDWVVEADECWKKGIVIYSVGVPKNNKFHMEMSARTCGTHLDMSGFDSTTDMILAICFKESNGGKHYDSFLKEVQAEGRMNEAMERMFRKLDGEEDDSVLVARPVMRRRGGSGRGRGGSTRGASRGRGSSRGGRGGASRGASRSMQIAVKTATIISSLLTVLTSAELRFFKDENVMPPVQPRTIREVLRVAEEVKADGGTIPAACLYESYKNKEVVKYFVLVTDEEENGDVEGMTWVELFKKYRAEVCADTKLVFISFLSDPKEKGQMMSELAKEEITPMQFKLNAIKPDLTKMDAFLALLSSDSKEFNQQTEEFSKTLRDGTPLYQLLKRVHNKEILSTYKNAKKEETKEEDGKKGKCTVS
eukprot:TRINITY_DN4002_c0_g3_i3.p1 TRINITY_DN4002_c0_g3~~TRINITY_DN4002_c0_g3_i3.p1  ORF type:complete len:816 (+),score=306.18 TRINITY_DN4002_c0_g3_i3:261-2708(+)